MDKLYELNACTNSWVQKFASPIVNYKEKEFLDVKKKMKRG